MLSPTLPNAAPFGPQPMLNPSKAGGGGGRRRVPAGVSAENRALPYAGAPAFVTQAIPRQPEDCLSRRTPPPPAARRERRKADGKVLKSRLAGDVELTIEPATAASLTATLPADTALVGDAQRFTPHGTTFASPVTITLTGVGDANTVLRLDDDNDTTWEVVNGATFSNGVATFETTSFSLYAAAKLTATAERQLEFPTGDAENSPSPRRP